MLVVTKVDSGIAEVVIDRSEAMNAISPGVLAELHAAVDVVMESGARVCVVTGAGDKAFSAGADLEEMLAFTDEQALAQLREGHRLTRRLETGPFISIAAINGHALGGGLEIALACSLRYAAPSARLGLPEVTVGIFPGWGGAVRLARQIPQCLALDMLVSGRILTAEEAGRCGLVCDVVEDPLAAARAAAARVLSAGPSAQLLARRVANETLLLDMDDALELSNKHWMTLMSSPERVEGHRAFLEKRSPNWAVVA